MEKRSPATPTRTRKRNGQGSVSRKPNGKGYYTLTISRDYRKKVLYFHTQREAEAKRKELVNQEQVNLGPEMTVRDALNAWLKEIEGTIKPSTLTSYRIHVAQHLIPSLGHVRLSKLETGQVHSMMMEATKGSRNHKGVSNRTANHLRTILGTALNFAMARRWLNWNPAMLTRPLSVEHFEGHAMTLGEREQFETALKGYRHEVAFLLALGYGLRQGELLGLTWGDIDLDGGWLTVRKSMHKGQRGETKTKGSRRRLPLVLNFPALLREHRSAQTVTALDGSSLVFATASGSPFSGRNITRDFKKVLKRAGLPASIRFHDLRHATASFLEAKGVPAVVAQAILGHSDIRTTLQVYTHTQDDEIRAALEAINQR
jgi:integrase